MSVELIESMGNDLSIVNAARVSYAKESKLVVGLGIDDMVLSQADVGLINYLMKNRHGTPFEMCVFKFRISDISIRVAREWQRHRIGSFNEVSTRYVEMEPSFYKPKLRDVRIQVGKPGHYTYESADPSTAESAAVIMQAAYDQAYKFYKSLLKLGVAKELAAFVLPMATHTQFIWTVNLRSLFNFLSLRTASNALLEIRVEADEVALQVAKIVPVAYQAWELNGKVAP